jgi:hypothetical protein
MKAISILRPRQRPRIITTNWYGLPTKSLQVDTLRGQLPTIHQLKNRSYSTRPKQIRHNLCRRIDFGSLREKASMHGENNENLKKAMGTEDPVKSMETIGPPYKYGRCRA